MDEPLKAVFRKLHNTVKAETESGRRVYMAIPTEFAPTRHDSQRVSR